MNPVVSDASFNQIFFWLPWFAGTVIIIVTYLMARGHVRHAVPVGKTYACAGCGRRGVREHMVPQNHEGAVSWYCSRCSGGH